MPPERLQVDAIGKLREEGYCTVVLHACVGVHPCEGGACGVAPVHFECAPYFFALPGTELILCPACYSAYGPFGLRSTGSAIP